MRVIDNYADGRHVSSRRVQKAELLGETLARLFPGRGGLTLVDFGCADGAVPVEMLRAPGGTMIERCIGITLLDYNDLQDKPAHVHPRFARRIHDLQYPLDDSTLPWGATDAVLATAFFHYCEQPQIPFGHAYRLLKPGGYLLAGLPARWVLWLRRHGCPLLLPRNTRIRHLLTLSAWRGIAENTGFREVSHAAVQWLGIAHTRPLESWLRRSGLLPWLGSNYLAVYRKPESVNHPSIDR